MAGLEPLLGLVDDIDPAFAAHNAAVFVARFQGLEGTSDFHGSARGVKFEARRIALAGPGVNRASSRRGRFSFGFFPTAAAGQLQRQAGLLGIRAGEKAKRTGPVGRV